jgi:hypothetical protein
VGSRSTAKRKEKKMEERRLYFYPDIERILDRYGEQEGKDELVERLLLYLASLVSDKKEEKVEEDGSK